MSDYSVENEDGYARTYDEDEEITIRKGDLRAVLDVGTMSMDFASGFLVEEQVEALRKAARLLGIDPMFVTPHNFVCKYTGQHEWHPQRGRVRVADPVAESAAAEVERCTEQLVAAKASGDREAHRAAAEELHAARVYRSSLPVNLPEWVDGEYVAEWCWRCGARRPIEPGTEPEASG